MAKVVVNNPDGFATHLKEYAGANIQLTNSSAVDVYYDVQQGGVTLNATLPGAIPNGTKIAASGGQQQFQECPRDLWIRAATQTLLDVQSNAPKAETQVQTVRAGDARGSNNKFQIGVPTQSRILSKQPT